MKFSKNCFEGKSSLSQNLQIEFKVLKNDNPYGLLSVSENTRTLYLKEDKASDYSNSSVVIERKQGAFGSIQVCS